MQQITIAIQVRTKCRLCEYHAKQKILFAHVVEIEMRPFQMDTETSHDNNYCPNVIAALSFHEEYTLATPMFANICYEVLWNFYCIFYGNQTNKQNKQTFHSLQ